MSSQLLKAKSKPTLKNKVTNQNRFAFAEITLFVTFLFCFRNQLLLHKNTVVAKEEDLRESGFAKENWFA
jgi:hypothetical protein